MAKVQVGLSSLNTATQFSSQTKIVKTTEDTLVLFANLGNGSGNRIKYKVSTDSGATWSASWIVVYNDADVTSFDVYIDTNNNIYLAIELSSALKWRQLTYSAGTWSNESVVEIVGSQKSIPNIVKRANGDLWVIANGIYGYYSTDTGSTWNATSIYKAGTVTKAIAHGDDIWVFYRSGTALYLYIYTSSWAYTSTISVGLGVYSNSLDAIKITDDNIWVATRMGSGIKVFHWNGSVWDSGILLSDSVSDRSPTIANIGGNPVCAWRDYSASQWDIHYRKYTGSTWAAEVDITNDSGVDEYPSVLDSDAYDLCTCWTTTDAPDYVIYFRSIEINAPPAITTLASTDIETTIATLNGNLTSLGGSGSVKVWFEYKLATDSIWTETTKEIKSSTGSFSADISGLTSTKAYNFKAMVSATDDTGTVTGNTLTFTTAMLSYFEWKTADTKLFEWYAAEQHTNTKYFEWVSQLAPRFCPNLINFNFSWLTPVVIDKKQPITVSGCLYGYSIFMANTGDSGSTIIEIYINSVLKKTITITADNAEHLDTYYFDLSDMLNPQENIEVKVTSVASNSSDLDLDIYQMSFPFEVDKLFTSNLKNDVLLNGINREYIFSGGDYWVLEFNQPIDSVVYVSGVNANYDNQSLTYEIVNGLFYKSRLKITPYTAFLLKNLDIQLKDLSGKTHTFQFDIIHKPNFSDFPNYCGATSLEVITFISPEYYSYSFDNVTWSSWAAPSNNRITIDFSAQTEGTKTLYMKYRKGSQEITESKSIAYYSSVITCDIQFYGDYAELTYTDTIPFSKVQVYKDDSLTEELTFPIYTGFSTVTTDETSGKISISDGSVYHEGIKYDYTETEYTLLRDDSTSVLWLVVFGFNYTSRAFEWKEFVSGDTASVTNLPENFYVIYKTTYNITLGSTLVYFPGIVEDYIDIYKISLEDKAGHTIKLRVLDIMGRYVDFEMSYVQQVYDLWRTLAVTDASSNVVEQGQIHFNSNLTYTITTEEKE